MSQPKKITTLTLLIALTQTANANLTTTGDVTDDHYNNITAWNIGHTAIGFATLSNGQLHSAQPYTFTARNPNAIGTLNIQGVNASGTPSKLVSPSIRNGYSGNGTINILDGGILDSYTIRNGWNTGSIGTLNIDGIHQNGTPSSLPSSNIINGIYGYGITNISAGGQAHADNVYNGMESGSKGTLIINSANSSTIQSTLATGDLWNGNSGIGLTKILNGGIIYASDTYNAREIGSKATLIIKGTNNNLQPSLLHTRWFKNGSQSTAITNIEDGGQVIATDLINGFASTSTGTINIKGTSTNNAPSKLSTEDFINGKSGAGILNITVGGLA